MPRSFLSTSDIAQNLSAVPHTSGPLTMACWHRPRALGAAGTLMMLGQRAATGNDHKWLMTRTAVSRLEFRAATTSSTTLTNTSVSFQANTWAHCLVSSNATYCPNRAVLDGVVATLTASNRIPAGVDSLIVGHLLTNTTSRSQSANGDIFWPAIWNAQLTADEERALFDGVSPRLIRPQALVWFVEVDDQRRIWQDAIGRVDLDFAGSADTAQYIPDIPPPVAARLPRRSARIYAFPSTGGAQTISPSGIASAEAFGTPSISVGAVSIGPSGIASAEAVGTPVVTIGAVTLSPSGVASAEAFGGAALTVGAVAVSPSAIASAETHGASVVAMGGANVAPSGIASVEAHGAALLSAGPVAVSPAGVASAEAHGSTVVSAGGAVVAPSGVATAEAAGMPSLTTGAVSVAPGAIASAEAHGSHTLTQGAQIAPTGIATGEAAGSPVLTTGAVTVAPTGIATSETHGSHVVSAGAVSVVPSGVATAEAHGAHTLLQMQAIAPTGVATEEAAGPPVLSVGAVTLAPAGIITAENIGAHVLIGGVYAVGWLRAQARVRVALRAQARVRAALRGRARHNRGG